MTTIKISQLPAATLPLTGAEVVPLVQSNVTKKVAVNNLATSVWIDVYSYGAVGDGTTDDTAAINNALAAAKTAKAVVVFPKGTFAVNNKIFVDSGVRGMLGLGGKIKFTTDTAMILLRGKQSGQAANVFDFTMSDLYIDANEQNINVGAGTFAVIIGENVQRCSFYNNVIEKVNWANGKGGIYLRSYLAGTAFTIYNRIIGNVITGDTIAGVNDPNGTCVAIDVLNAELNIAPYATPTAYWKATFTAANATYYGQWNVIADNVLHGGYYGVGLSAAQYTTVTGNVIRNVVRGVSVQNVSLYNNISNNVFLQMISTGVSFAYGSSHNVISSNDFQSSVCFGESVLESYVGSKDNSFNDNVIRLSGLAPKFYAYCAVQSDNCAFINNRFSGETACASMGVESAWNNAITNPASYSFNNTSFINGFTGSGMTGVRLEGNRIANLANIPAIFTYQVSDGAGDYELTRCSIVSNIVMDSNPNYQLEMAEMSSGDSNSHILMNNSFFPTEDGPGFYLWARGRAMFAFVSGNTPVNFPVSVAGYADANATPNVAYNDYVNLATYTTPTTVTNFTGGQQGQVINVRLNTVVTIAHNANINLKNAVNLTGSSSLDFVTLLNINGTLWVEVNRSLYLANPDNAVTQLTSRTTAVTNNTVRGQITLFSAAGSTSPTSFTLNNSFIAVTDSIVINQRAGTDEYVILITNIAAGSCEITFYTTGGTTTEQPIFQFSLVKNAVAN